jgi:hypothetical protein
VIFVAHAGLDRIVTVGDVWRNLRVDQAVRARWWRVPAAEVPRSADHEAQVRTGGRPPAQRGSAAHTSRPAPSRRHRAAR